MSDVLDKVGIVVAAAGSSTRYGQTNKLLESLLGAPLFLHSMRRFWGSVPATRTVLVVPAGGDAPFVQAMHEAGVRVLPIIVEGGASRAESVLHGLQALPPECSLVAVQDAARPLTAVELLRRCVESARQLGSGVAARRVTDTIKRADPHGVVQHTLDRTELWAAETPQAFPARRLRDAYRYALNQSAVLLTDEASAMEAAGEQVQLVESTEPNPKITTPADLKLARAWMESG